MLVLTLPKLKIPMYIFKVDNFFDVYKEYMIKNNRF